VLRAAGLPRAAGAAGPPDYAHTDAVTGLLGSFGGSINASAGRNSNSVYCLHHGLEVLTNPDPPPSTTPSFRRGLYRIGK
jgi:hypothetical protein